MLHLERADLALPGLKAANKSRVFEALADILAGRLRYPADQIVSHMARQEARSGPFAVGDGVAIPNFKLPRMASRFITIASLDTPVDFGAYDDQNVDLVCLLVSPENDGNIHLRRLSRLSRMLKSKALCQKLRETADPETMLALMINPEGWMLAA